MRVIVAGLDQDFRCRPFGPMPHLLAIAEKVDKALAICVSCGRPSHRTERVSSGDALIDVGAGDKYRAVCRRCYTEQHAAALQKVG